MQFINSAIIAFRRFIFSTPGPTVNFSSCASWMWLMFCVNGKNLPSMKALCLLWTTQCFKSYEFNFNSWGNHWNNCECNWSACYLKIQPLWCKSFCTYITYFDYSDICLSHWHSIALSLSCLAGLSAHSVLLLRVRLDLFKQVQLRFNFSFVSLK